MVDGASPRELWELAPCRALDPAFLVTVKDAPAADEPARKRLLDRLEHPEKAVDGAARGVFPRAVDTDSQQMLITPVAGADEWHTVRFPLREKAIDFGEQPIRVGTGERTVAPEYPDP